MDDPMTTSAAAPAADSGTTPPADTDIPAAPQAPAADTMNEPAPAPAESTESAASAPAAETADTDTGTIPIAEEPLPENPAPGSEPAEPAAETPGAPAPTTEPVPEAPAAE